MASIKPVNFSIDFDEDGIIVSVKKATGEEVPRQSADMLYELMPNASTCNKSMTEIYTITLGDGQHDPCILQGGDLWCW